jgi:hypothetical protein
MSLISNFATDAERVEEAAARCGALSGVASIS